MGELAFRLRLVEAAGEWVVSCRTDRDEEAVRTIPAPYSAEDLERVLHEVEKAFLRAAAPALRRAAPDLVPRQVGERMSGAILGGDVRVLFDRCRARARDSRESVLVHLDTVGPTVSRIPWELLTDPAADNDYLALRLPIVRSPHLLEIPRRPPEIAPPLRVLCVMSSPHDLVGLDVGAERHKVSQALSQLSSELVYVEWLEGDRWEDLANTLRFKPWHVLHFIGHGGFDEESGCGYIELADEHGRAMPVSGTDLGRLVASNAELRLVVLNACEQATAGGGQGVFASTAAKLMREGIPAVVAMQYEISDSAAVAFSCQFYEALARGLPIDTCVTLARETVKVTLGSLEWATPVLFLASDQRQIFRVPSLEKSSVDGDDVMVRARLDPSLPWQPSTPQPSPLSPGAQEGTTPTTRIPHQPPPPPPVAVPGGWVDTTRERVGRYLTLLGFAQPPVAPVPAQPPIESPARPHVPPSPPRPPTVQPGPRLDRPARHARRLATLGPAVYAAVGPGGAVAVAGRDGVTKIFSTASGQLLGECTLPRRERLERVAWSPWLRYPPTR